MNDNTKLEIAIEIIAAKIAKVAREKNGVVDEELRNLLKEREEAYKFNEEVIDKIINVYGAELKADNMRRNQEDEMER